MNMQLAMVAFGVTLCSILGILIATKDGGIRLKQIGVRYMCQLYLVLLAAVQLYISHDTVLQQAAAFILFGLGVIPLFLNDKQLPMLRGIILIGMIMGPLVFFFL